MKKNLYMLFATLFFITAAAAQKVEGIAGFLRSGYIYVPNAEKTFKNIYPQNGYGFTNNFFSFGAEAYYRHNHAIFIADGNVGLQKVYSWNNNRTGAIYEAANTKLGWVIAEDKNYWIYPAIGGGVSAMLLTTYEKLDNTNSITSTNTLLSPSFDFGMNADALLSKLKWSDKYYLGWMMGIRAATGWL